MIMYHSLTFGNKNTWDDWHIVPESRPVINTPTPKTEYVDIPGMDGSLDYTEALAGIKYNNREGSWKFYVMNDYGKENYSFEAWYELYNAIAAYIHGRKLWIYSEDDPGYVYHGRLTLDSWDSEKDYSKITINYVIDPYKYKGGIGSDGYAQRSSDSSTSGNDWKWDELYDLMIIYGKFDVKGTKYRTLYNNTNKSIEISIQTTSEISVEFDGKKYIFKAGKTRDSGIVLEPGSNKMIFTGNARVIIDYDKDGVII